MRKKIIFLIMIFLAFWACKSPMDPKIEEIIGEKVEKPKAVIGFSVAPNPICFQKYGQFAITLAEHNNVGAKLNLVCVKIYFDGFYAPLIYGTETGVVPCYGFINVGDCVIPAHGELDIPCKLWVPYASAPVKVEITIHIRDTNANEIRIWREIRATGGG